MTSSPHGPYVQGYTRATMAGTRRGETGMWGQSQKAGLSSEWSLRLDCRKSEALVIAGRHAAGNAFPGRGHTARQATGVDWSRSA